MYAFRPSASPDIDSLEQANRYLGHCWVAFGSSHFLFLILKPVFEHCVGLGVMPTNWMEGMCKPLKHPCNVRDTYWHALQNRYLSATRRTALLIRNLDHRTFSFFTRSLSHICTENYPFFFLFFFYVVLHPL